MWGMDMKAKTVLSVCLILLLGGILMFGCSAAKYKVDYDGHKSSYTGAKDSYPAGAKVTLYYEFIATDTDYSFYLDGESLKYEWDEKHGFAITFTMPDHDVKLECRSRNSMVYDPDADR